MLFVAGEGFEPPTSRLWALRATSAPPRSSRWGIRTPVTGLKNPHTGPLYEPANYKRLFIIKQGIFRRYLIVTLLSLYNLINRQYKNNILPFQTKPFGICHSAPVITFVSLRTSTKFFLGDRPVCTDASFIAGKHCKSIVALGRCSAFVATWTLFVLPVGLEPTPPLGDQILGLARLPIPPQEHFLFVSTHNMSKFFYTLHLQVHY